MSKIVIQGNVMSKTIVQGSAMSKRIIQGNAMSKYRKISLFLTSNTTVT
jgi:hypothetical protein